VRTTGAVAFGAFGRALDFSAYFDFDMVRNVTGLISVLQGCYNAAPRRRSSADDAVGAGLSIRGGVRA